MSNEYTVFYVPRFPAGPLGVKQHGAGNTTRYIVDYSRWLDDGVSLSAAPAPTVVMDPLTATVTDITIANITLLAAHNRISFTLAGGTVNENFTLDVQVSDSRSEVKKNTLNFTVVAP